MKKNAILKAVAAILLSVSIITAFVSGAVIAMLGEYGLQRDDGQILYNERLEEIADEKTGTAAEYYQTYLRSLKDKSEEHLLEMYKDDFSEENSNYYFRITPEDTDQYPGLANYYTDAYQYHDRSTHSVSLYEDEIEFTYDVSLKKIVDYWKEHAKSYYKNPDIYNGMYQDGDIIGDQYSYYPNEYDYDDEYDYDEYDDAYDDAYENGQLPGDIYADGVLIPREIAKAYGNWDNITLYDLSVWVDDPDDRESNVDTMGVYLYLDGTNFQYNLSKDTAFRKEYEKTVEKYKDATIYCSGVEYDNKTVTLTLAPADTVLYQIDSYVKSTFTANDEFSNSIFLKYCKTLVHVVVPVFAISIVLILVLGGFLIASAGHRKGTEEMTCNLFDRIPYDIFLALAVALVCGASSNLYWYSYSRDTMLMVLMIFGSVAAFLFPPFLMTTATRLKVDGWGMFRNTVIWRICKLIGRCLQYLWKKAKDVCIFLGKHFNLYWKWLGGFLGIEFIKILIIVNADYDTAAVLAFVFVLLEAGILIRKIRQLYTLKHGAEIIAGGDTEYVIDTAHMPQELKEHGEDLNSIRDGIKLAVEDRLKSERMKTELITNVSHDIKTPLTSIISYVDLISKEDGLNEKAQEYVDVLKRQSARLKKLIEDLIEASKASTGNLEVHPEKMDVAVLVNQVVGEFEERLESRGLQTIVTNHAESAGEESRAYVIADGRHLWRVFDNLIGNILKYAQEGSRVYIDIEEAPQSRMIQVVFKNISREPLNISGDELMERFVRGDRSRNTEGSGLGLSIAKNLMELQGGKVEIMIDGDLFKVVLLLRMAQ